MRRIPTLAEVERKYILTALRLCSNNRTVTAKALGLSLRGLRMKLQKYEEDGFEIPRTNGRRRSSGRTTDKDAA
jgi:DNA-binding NtrC family response regulator